MDFSVLNADEEILIQWFIMKSSISSQALALKQAIVGTHDKRRSYIYAWLVTKLKRVFVDGTQGKRLGYWYAACTNKHKHSSEPLSHCQRTLYLTGETPASTLGVQ